MSCPSCGASGERKNGRTKAGSQRWRCVSCLSSWTEKPVSIGRPTKSAGKCPYCHSSKTKKNGNQRVTCKSCDRSWGAG